MRVALRDCNYDDRSWTMLIKKSIFVLVNSLYSQPLNKNMAFTRIVTGTREVKYLYRKGR